MPGSGRPMAIGDRLHHDHVPTPVEVFDRRLLYAVLARGNDQVCDGMVGRSCCMIGCGTATPPIFAPSDFGFAIRASLFNAEGKCYDGIGVWQWFEVGCVFVAL